MADDKSIGFRTFYSRPPFFMVVTASTAEQLAAKVAELDARMKDAPTEAPHNG